MADYVLRKWRISDLDSLVKHADNYRVARFLSNTFPHPYLVEDGKRFLRMVVRAGGSTTLFAIEVDGEAVGGIGLTLKDDIYCRNAEIGYWLSESYWGRGIMTGAIRETTEYAFRTFDIDRIFARIFAVNIASLRVLEKAGFRFETRLNDIIFKNGMYYDEIVYGIRRKSISLQRD